MIADSLRNPKKDQGPGRVRVASELVVFLEQCAVRVFVRVSDTSES